MLVKLKVGQLKLGMLIQEFCGMLPDEPYWRTSLRLVKPSDLERVVGSGIKEVWVESDDEVSDVAAGAFAEEVERASLVCREAAAITRTVFGQAREGKPLDLEKAWEVVSKISQVAKRRPDALLAVARQKDRGDYAAMHSVAVCALMASLARRMGRSDPEVLRMAVAGLLMDVGMAALPGAVLGKPGALSDSVRDQVRAHAHNGARLLASIQGMPEEAVEACASHHERYDGNGYPQALAEQEIPEVARMAAICDAYDAMTSDRPYKAGLSPADAMVSMAQWRHTQFDPDIFNDFERLVGIYPVGTLVKLSSNRLAVVVEQGSSLLHPVVTIFFDLPTMEMIGPQRLELIHGGERIVSKADPKTYEFGDLDAFWRFG